MTYKGYEAEIEYDPHERIYVGTLSNCSDLVSFHSDNVRDLREKFRLAVDNYLALCEKLGKIPG